MFDTLKRDWKAILIQSVLTTVLFVGSIWGLSYALGSVQRNQRVDDATAQIVSEIEDVKVLICEALSEADNPELVAAVKENCP